MTDKLLSLMKKGNELLGCDYAIIGGAMTWVSDSNLVSAISNAGAFGKEISDFVASVVAYDIEERK